MNLISKLQSAPIIRRADKSQTSSASSSAKNSPVTLSSAKFSNDQVGSLQGFSEWHFSPEDAAKLKPILTLLDLTSKKVYQQGEQSLVSVTMSNRALWGESSLELVGHELSVWSGEQGFKVAMTSETETIQVNKRAIQIVDYDHDFVLNFVTEECCTKWTILFQLARFEMTQLSKALTGTLISCVGIRLHNDMAAIMSGKHNLKTPVWANFGQTWKKCLCYVDKKAGEVRLFNDDNQLIAYIDDASECYFAPKAGISLESMYELDTIVIEGSVRITEVQQSAVKKSPWRRNSSGRQTPVASPAAKSNLSVAATIGSMEIKPIPNGGISKIEKLVRSMIPLFDAFELYGRPTKLEASRDDINSLFFGLPRLPEFNYFELSELHALEKSTGKVNLKEFLKRCMGQRRAPSSRGSSGISSAKSSPVML